MKFKVVRSAIFGPGGTPQRRYVVVDADSDNLDHVLIVDPDENMRLLKQSPKQYAEFFASAPKMVDYLRMSLGVIADLTTQIDQMKDMFDDDDGAIAAALEDAEDCAQLVRQLLGKIVPKDCR